MSIFERIRRITLANINSLLDKAEDPETMLTQKITELEETVQEAKEALAGFSVSFRRSENEFNALRQKRDEWKEHAVHALKNNDEAQATKALQEKVKIEQRLERLEPSLRESRHTFEQLKEQLTRLHDQLNAARNKMAELKSRQRSAAAQQAFGRSVDQMAASGVRGDEFNQMEDQVAQTESLVEIEREMRGDILTEQDMEAMTRDMKVSNELEALKKELGRQE